MAKNRGCFYDIRFFVVCYGFLMLTDIMAGVMKKSSLTTIERRFHLPSTTTALLASSFQIGSLTTVLFTTYIGARWHRPRTIFIGAIFLVIGNVITTLPQFLGGRYEYEDIASNISSSTTAGISECSVSNESSALEVTFCEEEEDNNQLTNLYILLVVGMMVNGAGGSSLFSLGLSYIDDFAHERNSPIYLGITQALSLVGPMVGYLMGAMVLKLWVDIGWIDVSTINITPTHPSWVGAWWLGLLLCTCGIAVAMLPFPYFPRKMEKQQYTGKKNDSKSEEEEQKDDQNAYDEAAQKTENKTSAFSREKKVIVHTLKSIATNHLFHLVVLKMYLVHAALVGVANFFPKYLEVGFGASASKANFLTGVINIPCVVIGTLVGAFIMKRLNLSSLGATKMIAVSVILATSCIIPLLFIGCETIDIAGITTPYSDRIAGAEPSVESPCNENCECASGTYAPVCGSDGLSYVSPCHAGCSGAEYNDAGMKQNFTDCSCISSNDNLRSWAKPERCQLSKCEDLATVVVAIKSVSGLFAGLTATPLYILMLRSVEKSQKSIAIALYLVIIRLLAWIPGPIIYGAFIDSACLYWGKKPCADRAYCKVYDNSAYRHRFYGLIVFFNVLSCFVAIALYYTVKKRDQKEKKKEEGKLENMNSNGQTPRNERKKEKRQNEDNAIKTVSV